MRKIEWLKVQSDDSHFPQGIFYGIVVFTTTHAVREHSIGASLKPWMLFKWASKDLDTYSSIQPERLR